MEGKLEPWVHFVPLDSPEDVEPKLQWSSPRRPSPLPLHAPCDAPLPPVGPRSLVLCVHGCNEVNVEAVEMARECGASWMVVPCCLKTELYVQLESMRLTDAMQYAFLCGSMAKAYGAERVATLDARVTPRSIVLSGGGRDQRERAREDRVACEPLHTR